jgi:hypothetical protein
MRGFHPNEPEPVMSIQAFAGAFALMLAAGSCHAAAPPETHKLRVHGHVSYRCYAGYDGKKVLDDRSGEVCDNQTSNKVLIDKVITITIVDEPDPENSRDLAGSWSEDVAYKGRTFTATFSLFKVRGAVPYSLSAVATDDEPQSRQTRVTAHMRTVSALNPLTVSYSSMGKKEEITFDLKVEAAK